MNLFLTLALILPLHAAPPSARDTQGQLISLAAGTLVVSWRLDDPASLEALRVAEHAADTLDVPVLALNVDGAEARSRLLPYLRAHGCRMPTLSDSDGAWQRQLQLSGTGMLVLGEDESVLARIEAGSDLAATRRALATALGRPEPLLAAGR